MTFEELQAEVGDDVGDVVLMYDHELVRLLGVDDGEDDYYYMGRPFGVNQKTVFYSVVGGYTPLKCYLPKEDYDRMNRVFEVQEEYGNEC